MKMNSKFESLKDFTKANEYRIKEAKYALYQIKRSPLFIIGIIIVATIIFLAIFAPFLVPYPKDVMEKVHTSESFKPPSNEHLFGTDSMGRDIFSRIIYGSRISLRVGIIVVILSLAIGVPLGGIAGYMGGIADDIIMRICDVFLSFPYILLPVVLSAAMGPNLTHAMIAIALTWWPWYVRIIRGQALSIKEKTFIEAAEAIGVKKIRIITNHLLPNTVSAVIVQASMDIGYAILATAALGFIGTGAQPPTPEWGLMIASERNYFLEYWWPATFPGLAILISVLGFNLIGDGLRDILDPKLRRS
jgi:peptide/nickel transport system permease protein